MMHRFPAFLLTVVVVCSSVHLQAQIGPAWSVTAPIERQAYERVTTHQELVAFLDELARTSTRFQVEVIGTTVQGRPIPMVHIPPPTGAPDARVLLFCQQHGNEPSGKEAMLTLLADWLRSGIVPYPNLDLYVVPSVNPDGNERKVRLNARDRDLNRNHVSLTEPEVQALHDVFNRIRHEITLDVHEFGVYEREWQELGCVRNMDEQFGAATNLNVSSALRRYGVEKMLPEMEKRLTAQGIRFFPYTIMAAPTDTARRSTTHINDGRQSLAIQNSYSFILEGRNGREMNDDLRRRVNGQRVAISAFLQFASEHGAEIAAIVSRERKALAASHDSVVVQMGHPYSNGTIAVPVRSLTTGRDSVLTMKFAPRVEPVLSVGRPAGYALHRESAALIDVLTRQRIPMYRLTEPREVEVDVQTVKDVRIWHSEEDENFIVATDTKRTRIVLQPGDVVVPLDHIQAITTVLALEPTSLHGLIQSPDFAALRIPGTTYPVYRLPAGTGK